MVDEKSTNRARICEALEKAMRAKGYEGLDRKAWSEPLLSFWVKALMEAGITSGDLLNLLNEFQGTNEQSAQTFVRLVERTTIRIVLCQLSLIWTQRERNSQQILWKSNMR